MRLHNKSVLCNEKLTHNFSTVLQTMAGMVRSLGRHFIFQTDFKNAMKKELQVGKREPERLGIESNR